MKFINISYTDKGGAGTAVLRTHQRLLKSGYDSVLYLAVDFEKTEPPSPKKNQKSFFIKRLINKATRLMVNAIKKNAGIAITKNIDKYCFYSTSELKEIPITHLLDQINDGDIVILYWLGNGVLNSADILQLYRRAGVKIFWYALDMAAITGGCHYYWECEGYKRGCTYCPVFNGKKITLASKQFVEKNINLRQVPVHLLCSSETGKFLLDMRTLPFEDCAVLPYAIDTDIFNIKATDEITAFTIFFNAQNIHDIRKGWEYFKEVMYCLDELLDKQPREFNICMLSVFSENHIARLGDLKHIQIKGREPAKSETALASLYQHSDLFICTSVEDLSPLMVNEALLCGIPVVAFDNASNKEYIINGMNGNLVKPFDTRGMAEVIYKVIKKEINYAAAIDIRKSIVNLHEQLPWKERFDKILNN